MKEYFGDVVPRNKVQYTSPPAVIDRTDSGTLYDGRKYSATYPGKLDADVSVFHGVDVPEFYKRVSEGFIILNPLRKETITTTYQTCELLDNRYFTRPGFSASESYTLRNMCDYAQFPTLFSPINFEAERKAAIDEAVTRVYAKAKSANVDLLIDLSQIRQLVRMFKNMAERFINLALTRGALFDIASIRNTDPTRLVRAYPRVLPVLASSLSGLWCEMRFGWRPFISSLQGIMDALRRLDLNETTRLTFRATELMDHKVSITNVQHSPLFTSWQTTQRHIHKMDYRSTIRAGIIREDRVTLAKALGFDKEYIAVAAWDLIPYSFLVDRILNVGQYIRSLMPSSSASFSRAWCVERYNVTHLYRSEYDSYSFSGLVGDTNVTCSRTAGANEVAVSYVGTRRLIFSKPPMLPVLRHDWSEIQDLYNLVDVAMLAIQRLVPRLAR
jgi:hypothetical protein